MIIIIFYALNKSANKIDINNMFNRISNSLDIFSGLIQTFVWFSFFFHEPMNWKRAQKKDKANCQSIWLDRQCILYIPDL